MKIDSTDFVRQYGIFAHWAKPFSALPDSQFLIWGYNAGGPGSVAKYTLAKSDTSKFFWATAPLTPWSIWSCASVYSGASNKFVCNSFKRDSTVLSSVVIHDTTFVHDTTFKHDTLKVPSGYIHDTTIIIRDTTRIKYDTTFVHDTVRIVGVAQYVFPRDTIHMAFDASTCTAMGAWIDSLTGVMHTGCTYKNTPVTIQMCMVSILSDSSVVWAKQSKDVCSDSIPKKKYGRRWIPSLGVDTTLIFELAGATWTTH